MPTAYDTWLEGNCGVDEAAEARAELAAELAEQYRCDADKLREAEQWIAGELDSEHYAAVNLALYRLHHTEPARLFDTDLLGELYKLAATVALRIEVKLYEMAEQDILDAEIQAEIDAAEARAAAREAGGAMPEAPHG